MPVMQFVEWAIPGETNPDTFFTDERVKTLYKNYIRDFLNHVNSQTGLAYKDDPTILSFSMSCLLSFAAVMLTIFCDEGEPTAAGRQP